MTNSNSLNNADIDVMLVDDNPDLSLVTARLLEHLDFRVNTYNGGLECIQALEVKRPDILLLDIQMPVMDGVSTCRHIRQQPWGQNLPIIAHTSVIEDFLDFKLEEAGFDRYLSKSTDPEKLAAAIWETILTKRIQLS